MSRRDVVDNWTQTCKWMYLLDKTPDQEKNVALMRQQIESLRRQITILETKKHETKLCKRCGAVKASTDARLRLLDDPKPNEPSEVPVTVDALQRQTRQTELEDKQTKLLQPYDWERRQKQEEEERQLQKKRQEEEAERKKEARLRELWQDHQRQKKSDWQERAMLRVFEPAEAAAATKPVPAPPPTQPPKPRRKLPPIPQTGQLHQLPAI